MNDVCASTHWSLCWKANTVVQQVSSAVSIANLLLEFSFTAPGSFFVIKYFQILNLKPNAPAETYLGAFMQRSIQEIDIVHLCRRRKS